jgi:hypothetical protein
MQKFLQTWNGSSRLTWKASAGLFMRELRPPLFGWVTRKCVILEYEYLDLFVWTC